MTTKRKPQLAATYAELTADSMAMFADCGVPGPFVAGSAVSALSRTHFPWPTAEQNLFAGVKRKLGGTKLHDRWARYKAMDAEVKECWAKLREPLPKQLPKDRRGDALVNARNKLLRSGFKGATSLDRIRHDYEDIRSIVEQLKRQPK